MVTCSMRLAAFWGASPAGTYSSPSPLPGGVCSMSSLMVVPCLENYPGYYTNSPPENSTISRARARARPFSARPSPLPSFPIQPRPGGPRAVPYPTPNSPCRTPLPPSAPETAPRVRPRGPPATNHHDFFHASQFTIPPASGKAGTPSAFRGRAWRGGFRRRAGGCLCGGRVS